MNTEIQHRGHTIKIIKEHPIQAHNLHGAIAAIHPPVTQAAEPDLMIGLGAHPSDARLSAFERAKDLININSPK